MQPVTKAVVTVLGIDRKGIIAGVSQVLFQNEVNILDISQTVLSGYFNMAMIVDISDPQCAFGDLDEALKALGDRMGLQIRIQRSEIFEAMHKV